jgi:hypothetical protein
MHGAGATGVHHGYSSADSSSDVSDSAPFMPVSSVFEGRMVFESDEDEPAASSSTVGGPLAGLPADAGLENLGNLFDVLSMKSWESCLTPKQRDELLKLVPQSTSSMSAEDNVTRLLSGDNFNFGNPVEQFHKCLKAGELSGPGAIAHKQAIKKEHRQYVARIHKYHKQMLANIVELRASLVNATGGKKESSEYPKVYHGFVSESDAEDEPGNPMVLALQREQVLPANVAPETSLFLAIRDAFQVASGMVTMVHLWRFIEMERPLAMPKEDEVPPRMDIRDFIWASLHFLAVPPELRHVAGLCPSEVFPSIPLLKYDQAADQWHWEKAVDYTEPRLQAHLLMLESAFMRPNLSLHLSLPGTYTKQREPSRGKRRGLKKRKVALEPRSFAQQPAKTQPLRRTAAAAVPDRAAARDATPEVPAPSSQAALSWGSCAEEAVTPAPSSFALLNADEMNALLMKSIRHTMSRMPGLLTVHVTSTLI